MMPLLAAIVERVRTWLGWPKPIDQPICRAAMAATQPQRNAPRTAGLDYGDEHSQQTTPIDGPGRGWRSYLEPGS